MGNNRASIKIQTQAYQEPTAKLQRGSQQQFSSIWASLTIDMNSSFHNLIKSDTTEKIN
jgi:hypothetical protein